MVSDTSGAPSAGDRRGKVPADVTYWSADLRRQRAEIFQRRERGETPEAIASGLGLDLRLVEAVLLSDRRGGGAASG